MFNFLRKQKNPEKDFELFSNPAILFNKQVPVNQLLLFGVSLGGSHNQIIKSDIITTSMEPSPIHINACRSIFRDNKRYFLIDGVETEYLLEDRIDSIIENDGWLHRRTGAKYRIEKKQILEFA